MQGPGAFVFSFFDDKLLFLMPIIMYVDLFSSSRNKLWPFGVAAYSAALLPGKGLESDSKSQVLNLNKVPEMNL